MCVFVIKVYIDNYLYLMLSAEVDNNRWVTTKLNENTGLHYLDTLRKLSLMNTNWGLRFNSFATENATAWRKRNDLLILIDCKFTGQFKKIAKKVIIDSSRIIMDNLLETKTSSFWTRCKCIALLLEYFLL